jgi:hypothetical protein
MLSAIYTNLDGRGDGPALFVLHDTADGVQQQQHDQWTEDVCAQTPWRPDVANNEDIISIQSDVGRWRRRERARRVFLCRSLFSVHGLLIRYLFVRVMAFTSYGHDDDDDLSMAPKMMVRIRTVPTTTRRRGDRNATIQLVGN